MVARQASVVVGLLLFIASTAAQDKPLRDVLPPLDDVAPARHVVQPVPGVVLPNYTVQKGPYVFDHPVHALAKHAHPHNTIGKIAHCRRTCCKCVSDLAHFLYYKPLPVPNECLECKHYVGGCNPDPMDFFVQRYGYYSWAARCAK